MAVSEILVLIPRVRFRRVVNTMVGHRISGHDRGALVKVERNVALQMNRKTQIRSGWKPHGSSTGRRRGVYGLVDGRRIERLPIASGSECTYVIGAGSRILPICDKNRESEKQDDGGPSHGSPPIVSGESDSAA